MQPLMCACFIESSDIVRFQLYIILWTCSSWHRIYGRYVYNVHVVTIPPVLHTCMCSAWQLTCTMYVHALVHCTLS